MALLDVLQPRDRSEAARTILTLSAVAAVVTSVLALVNPQSAGGRLIALAVIVPVVAVVVGAAWLLTRSERDHPIGWAVIPLLTVVAIVSLDLLTKDVSTSAQVFLFFPALYGSSQLPRWGAVILTAASIAGDIVIAFTLLPARQATIDATYVVAAIVTSAGLLVYAEDRRAALVERLQRQAAIDPLTGLVTRRVLDQAARSALSGAASVYGTALILLDVDKFKSVNDQYGHLAGDEVLIQLAHILLRSARSADIVSRMGGDEIALLLPGCSESAAIRRAEQLCSDVRAHAFMLSDGTQLTLSVSAGVAHAPTHATDLRPLYAAADTALYQAKRSGRDRVGMLHALTGPEVTERLRGAVAS
ncbi:GGDEF domain-containing protein [Jatrophihabitans telluris]|uniref:GGDEF domain-containing protein n=1 Tax=Jatrophihabitans telluris TaxID=2038343 RepID=A0ABY4QZI6_9ACTN|nr:GGDEF domain-containing protein [Jatrophihabitans telluris]UQX88276.1 GGDEF domain-containing protein [Jatrophihabitans telluris]